MSNINRAIIKLRANEVWQDSLAKFDPTRVEANGFELEMFRHGAEYVYTKALAAIDRMREDLITGQSIVSTIDYAKRALLRDIEEEK